MELSLTVDRFEAEKAILKTDNNDSIIWPKHLLPADIQEGSVLYYKITTDKAMEQDKKTMAKHIINEIINPSQNNSE